MARRDEVRENVTGGYIQTIKPGGYDVLINGTDRYLNFNTVSGFLGYGFRDNAGIMEAKNSGGAWGAIATSGDLSGYVPYTGATQTVDLNNNYLLNVKDLSLNGGILFSSTAEARGYYQVIGSTVYLTPGGLDDVTILGVYIGGFNNVTFRYTITNTSGWRAIPVANTADFAVSDPVEDGDSVVAGTVEAIIDNTYLIISSIGDRSGATFIYNSFTFNGTDILSAPYISDLGQFEDGMTVIANVPIGITPILNGMFPSASSLTGHTLTDIWEAATGPVEGVGLRLNFREGNYAIGDVDNISIGNQFRTNVQDGKSSFAVEDIYDSYIGLDTQSGIYKFGPKHDLNMTINTVTNSINLGETLGGYGVFIPGLASGSGPAPFLRVQSSDGRLFTSAGTSTGDTIGGAGNGVLYTSSGVLLQNSQFNYVDDVSFVLGLDGENYINIDHINNRMTFREPLGATIQLDSGGFFMKGDQIIMSTSGGDFVAVMTPGTGTFQAGDIPLLGAGGIFTVAGQAGIATFADLNVIIDQDLTLNGATSALYVPATITPGGTTGDQTIDKMSGSVNFALGDGTPIVVTNSLVTADSIILTTITTDASLTMVSVDSTAGSFTITPNLAPTAETKVGRVVFNS